MSSLTSILNESKIQNINPFLKEIDKIINWDVLMDLLKKIHVRDVTLRGRKPYSKLIMLKAILLQMWYNLSDVELENCLYDRLSFMKFCSFDLEDRVPDHSTISRFRTKLIKNNVYKSLFKEVNNQIEQHVVSLKSGSVIDSSLIHSHSRPQRKEYVEIEPTGDQEPSQKEPEVKLVRV
jgi:transposase, IS5 family